MRPHRDDMVSSFDVKKGKCYVELSGERKLQTFQFTERSNKTGWCLKPAYLPDIVNLEG